MNTKLYIFIAARIILLCIIGMAFTFITPELRAFFGDTKHVCVNQWCHHGIIDDKFDWGARHYWYYWTTILLFILSLLNVIISIFKSVEKHYPEIL